MFLNISIYIGKYHQILVDFPTSKGSWSRSFRVYWCLHTFCNASEGLGSTILLSMATSKKVEMKAGRIRSCINASDSCGRPLLTNRRRTSQVPNLNSPWVLSSTLDLNLNGWHVFLLGAPPSPFLASTTKSQGGLSSARRAKAWDKKGETQNAAHVDFIDPSLISNEPNLQFVLKWLEVWSMTKKKALPSLNSASKEEPG